MPAVRETDICYVNSLTVWLLGARAVPHPVSLFHSPSFTVVFTAVAVVVVDIVVVIM
ncbi:MAG: hypothetical protein J3R72DRAFT_433895 [Linnemannia gamsii]|nr:MAG: hypothetical protein J3R72DRAFT_433895 [Linnemannia gamsii]